MSNRTFNLSLLALFVIFTTAFWYKEPLNAFIDTHSHSIKDFRSSTTLEISTTTPTPTK